MPGIVKVNISIAGFLLWRSANSSIFVWTDIDVARLFWIRIPLSMRASAGIFDSPWPSVSG